MLFIWKSCLYELNYVDGRSSGLLQIPCYRVFIVTVRWKHVELCIFFIRIKIFDLLNIGYLDTGVRRALCPAVKALWLCLVLRVRMLLGKNNN